MGSTDIPGLADSAWGQAPHSQCGSARGWAGLRQVQPRLNTLSHSGTAPCRRCHRRSPVCRTEGLSPLSPGDRIPIRTRGFHVCVNTFEVTVTGQSDWDLGTPMCPGVSCVAVVPGPGSLLQAGSLLVRCPQVAGGRSWALRKDRGKQRWGAGRAGGCVLGQGQEGQFTGLTAARPRPRPRPLPKRAWLPPRDLAAGVVESTACTPSPGHPPINLPFGFSHKQGHGCRRQTEPDRVWRASGWLRAARRASLCLALSRPCG